MSVISPGMYREMHESDSWEELARERSRLVRRLRHFELHCDELLGDGRVMDPGPDVFYQCELEFLRELCDLTLRAMRRETGLADLFGDDEADGGEGEDTQDEAAAELPSQERIDEVNSQGFNIIDDLGNIRHFEGC